MAFDFVSTIASLPLCPEHWYKNWDHGGVLIGTVAAGFILVHTVWHQQYAFVSDVHAGDSKGLCAII